ncbi:MAG: transposase [Candidatus Rokubacteria bacterium]|nr:transposase [Candidatus Rokubacteria bacterium]
MSLSTGDYRPRDAEHAVLYRVIDEHLDAFLDTARRHADGAPLPAFVEQEFRDFLTCGVLAHGFARLRCTDCALERLVPFSCKGRGFCPSCGGRRMTECAARQVDEVLPRVPVRQWVLSLPYRLRYLLAWDHALARAVLGVYVRVLLGFQRQRARRYGICDGRSGSVTVIQRFGGGLNLNGHYHTLLFDGVFFADRANDALDFRPLPPPTDEEVGHVLARIAVRVQRLLKRRWLDPCDTDMCQADPVVEESPVLAGISSASIQGRIALGPRAGARVWRVGADPDAPWVLSTAPRHAHLAGFDLHANVDAPASDRTRLEQLCRYLLRPAVAQDRLRLLDDGRIVLTLKTAWADGTRQLLFEPLELLEKLAALIPRPRINLVLYHGVLAPHSGWRARVVAHGAPPAEAPVVASAAPEADDEPTTAPVVRYWAWADLMRRAFDIDVLACPRCGGRLRLIATVEAPDAIRAILGALAESEGLVGRAPPPVPALNASQAAATGA